MAERKTPLDQKKSGTYDHRKKQKSTKKTLLRKIVSGAVLVVLIAGLTATAVGINYIWDTPAIDRAALETVQTSYLYDYEGNEVAALHGEENRILVPLADIPKHVQESFIAIEDERFYKHFGFDMIGFTRAIFVNLRTRSFSQGASTITQQLVQNAFLTTDQTVKRKAQEIWLAIKFERQYSKEEILEMYLNRIYFGEGAYGVEAAAQTYFNKNVGQLELHEAALLAALVRAPGYYNPFAYEEEGIARMKRVLGNMQRLNYISDAEYQQAMNAEFIYAEPPTLAYPHPYFIDYVVHNELLRILSDLSGINDREEAQKEAYNSIYTGGLKVFTTLNVPLQDHVENVLNDDSLYPRTLYIDIPKLREAISANNGRLPADYPAAYIDEENGRPQPQSALVLADPKTGEIWALGGGRDYAKNRNEVLRYRSLRQPGSAIKPVLTYAPAIEEGLLGAGSVLDDAPLIGPGGWTPENYDGQFRGMTSVRNALAYSYNIPAVRAYQMLGLEKGAEYAYKMGLSTFKTSPNDPAYPSWTLGARDVTTLDMTQAFAVFANDGIRVDLHTIQRIEDRNGRVIYEHKIDPVQVLSPQTTFIINDILQDVVRYTTARGLQSPRPMAAKTGTTDDARDIYLSAYAPNVIASFWMGYDENLMGSIPNGWNYTTAILREVFSEVFTTLPVEQFKSAPSGVRRVEVCTKSGLLPSDQCREAGAVTSDYFLTNHAPRVTCNMHVMLTVCAVSGQLAGEYCPEEDIHQQAFFSRPDYIITDARWRKGAGRAPLDAGDKPPTETCTVHTEFTGGITSFTAEVRNNEIRLEWEYSGPKVLEFNLYRQADNESEATLLVSLAANQRRYTDKAVQAGKTYTYSLSAMYEHGPSEAVVAKVNLVAEKPPTPEEFKASHIDNNIRLDWHYPSGSNIDGFIIRRTTEDGGSTSFDVLAHRRDYLDSGAHVPGLYSYHIVAIRQGVESEAATTEIAIPNGSDSAGTNSTGLWTLLYRNLPLRIGAWIF